MKIHKIIGIKLLLAFLACMVISSCEYKEIADANYPDQQIYLPIASQSGYYIINSVPSLSTVNATPGQPLRFTVDINKNQFNIPLSVYRSGINNIGTFNVDISVNTDTITKLIASESLDNVTSLLPNDKYSIGSNVNLIDGKESGSFMLHVDLGFLKTMAPNKKFALAVSIASAERPNIPSLSTGIIVIDTKIMIPTASFTYTVDATNSNNINFTNTSQNIATNIWDFGDGLTSTTPNPTHAYTEKGNYTVKLTVTGVSGDELIKTTQITVGS